MMTWYTDSPSLSSHYALWSILCPQFKDLVRPISARKLIASMRTSQTSVTTGLPLRYSTQLGFDSRVAPSRCSKLSFETLNVSCLNRYRCLPEIRKYAPAPSRLPTTQFEHVNHPSSHSCFPGFGAEFPRPDLGSPEQLGGQIPI